MIKSVNGKARTEAQVAAFNKAIYRGLCSGRKRSFTYINTCTNLQMKGWISKKSGIDIYDGVAIIQIRHNLRIICNYLY